jgi:acid phosphatase type 7
VEVLKILLTTRFSVKALATILGVGLCLALIVTALVFGGVFPSKDAPPQDDPVLVGAGDIADFTDSDEATAALIRDYSGTVFTLGDNAYGTASEAPFDLYYESTWGTEKSRTKPTPGNHEYEHKNGAEYFDYFGAVAAEDNGGSYSYERGDWHIIALNTGSCYGRREADGSRAGCGLQDPMLVWLESDLQANQKQCTMVYFHHPLFSSSARHGGYPDRAKAIWDLLYSYDADVVVNGHEHQYERFAPQDPNGVEDTARGIRQFVVGTGGRGLDGFGMTATNSEVRNSDTHGVIKFILRQGSYEWEFIPIAGKTFTDSGSHNCH